MRIIDERCNQYEQEWTAGRSPHIETYLAGINGEDRVVLWLELVLVDQQLRRRRGETPTLAEYQDQCPDWPIVLDVETDPLGALAAPGQPVTEPEQSPLPPVGSNGHYSPTEGPSVDEERSAPGEALHLKSTNGTPSEGRFDPLLTRAVGPDDATAAFPTPSRTSGADQGAAELDGMAAVRPGARLGDFELIEPMGAGGLGIVYKARQVSLNRLVAV
jgi:hypothetical protein